MAEDVASFSLTLPSDPRMISICRGFLEAVCQTMGIDSHTLRAVVLATGEAVANIIYHAHGNRPEAKVEIRCRFQPGEMEICLFDEGDPFDIDAVPHLDPSELRLGGRGVFLMRTLMDELSCQPRGPQGNTLRMVKRWSPALPARHCG